MHRGEVAGADHDVDVLRHLYEAFGCPAVSMKVAEREQAHGQLHWACIGMPVACRARDLRVRSTPR